MRKAVLFSLVFPGLFLSGDGSALDGNGLDFESVKEGLRRTFVVLATMRH